MVSATQHKFWTLEQASAWVVFRSDAVVQKFSPPYGGDFRAFMSYPSMRQGHPEIGKMSDLFDALRSGRLKAFARLNSAGATVTEIPVAEWRDMVADVRGPYRHPDDGRKDYPWINIQVRRADVEKLWRRTPEIQARTKFDWDRLRALFEELRALHNDLSQNELIIELQGVYQDKTGKEPPSRSTMQRQMRDW